MHHRILWSRRDASEVLYAKRTPPSSLFPCCAAPSNGRFAVGRLPGPLYAVAEREPGGVAGGRPFALAQPAPIRGVARRPLAGDAARSYRGDGRRALRRAHYPARRRKRMAARAKKKRRSRKKSCSPCQSFLCPSGSASERPCWNLPRCSLRSGWPGRLLHPHRLPAGGTRGRHSGTARPRLYRRERRQGQRRQPASTAASVAGLVGGARAAPDPVRPRRAGRRGRARTDAPAGPLRTRKRDRRYDLGEQKAGRLERRRLSTSQRSSVSGSPLRAEGFVRPDVRYPAQRCSIRFPSARERLSSFSSLTVRKRFL